MVSRKITIFFSSIPLFIFSICSADDQIANVTIAANEITPSVQTEEIAEVEEIPAKQVARDFTQVAKKATPAVVSIKVQQKGKTNSSIQSLPAENEFFNDDFFQRFFGFSLPDQIQNQPTVGQASGFIVTPDGYILTNNHVVKDASSIIVTLNDGREFEAKVIGKDANTDISVIKISGHDLPTVKLGDSDKLEVGEWVVAIGNPLGLQASLTVGVVSAKGRNNLDLTREEEYIQTDAAINRGNSGGPLLNLDGEVVGMNSAIATSTGGYMGLGFSIPSNMLKRIMDQLITKGSVTRGYLGIVLQKIDQDLAQAFNLEKTHGVLIAEVAKNSPAQAAGLKQGDVIIRYNGNSVDNMGNFRNIIASTPPGTNISLTIQRADNVEEIPVTVGTLPDAQQSPNEVTEQLGLTLQELTPEIAQKLGYQNEKGVIITEIDPSSISALAGIKKGSLILSVNQQKVSSLDEFHAALKKTEKGKPVLLLIKQGNVIRFVSLRAE